MKGVHLIYQFQVVYDDVYIRVALAKPRKWLTQSALIMTPIFQKSSIFFMCSHLKLLKEFLSMTLTLPYQYQKVINSSLPSKSNKTTKYL
jgi:hypothetical protein